MSPGDPPPFAHGSIVLVAAMLDPHGRNPEDRPGVVVTKPGDAPDGHQVGVATSTPLPDDHVQPPWHRSNHPRTGPNKRDAAIGRWVEIVEDSRIIRAVGIVPDGHLMVLAGVLDRPYPIEGDGEGPAG